MAQQYVSDNPYDPYKQAQKASYDQSASDFAGFARSIGPRDYTAQSAPPAGYNPTTGVVTAPSPSYPVHTGIPSGTVPGNEFKQFPNKWWNKIPGATFGDIINNPDQFIRMWTSASGLGEQTANRLQNFAPMPINYLMGMGLGDYAGQSNPMQRQAEQQTSLLQQMLEGSGGTGRANYIDPREIMKNAISAVAVKDKDGNYSGHQNPLAMQFGDPAVPPQDQADNFIKYVASTVGNLLPQASAQSLINVYQREKNMFLDYLTKNPTVSVTFNRWINDRLGPNGGL